MIECKYLDSGKSRPEEAYGMSIEVSKCSTITSASCDFKISESGPWCGLRISNAHSGMSHFASIGSFATQPVCSCRLLVSCDGACGHHCARREEPTSRIRLVHCKLMLRSYQCYLSESASSRKALQRSSGPFSRHEIAIRGLLEPPMGSTNRFIKRSQTIEGYGLKIMDFEI